MYANGAFTIAGVSKVTKENEKFIHPALVWLIRKARGTPSQSAAGAMTERYELSSPYMNGNGASSLKLHPIRNGKSPVISNGHDNLGFSSNGNESVVSSAGSDQNGTYNHRF